jgi:hypothetical protein
MDSRHTACFRHSKLIHITIRAEKVFIILMGEV